MGPLSGSGFKGLVILWLDFRDMTIALCRVYGECDFLLPGSDSRYGNCPDSPPPTIFRLKPAFLSISIFRFGMGKSLGRVGAHVRLYEPHVATRSAGALAGAFNGESVATASGDHLSNQSSVHGGEERRISKCPFFNVFRIELQKMTIFCCF